MTGFDQFKELIGLHQFYFRFLLTSTQFYMGIVGGLLAYCLKSGMNEFQLRCVLIVPLLLCLVMFGFYLVGYFKLRELGEWVRSTQRALQLAWRPHTEMLPMASLCLAMVSGVISVLILFLFVRPDFIVGLAGK